MNMFSAVDNSEWLQGSKAAHDLCDLWPDTDWIPENPSIEWAKGAINAFAEIVREQRPIFRASQRRSEVNAAMLSPRPFQGLSEALQNADDLAASELRIVLRHAPRRELLLIHNGTPVSLAHMGAMVLPYLSTKTEDDEASGRFGIGQKTLKALGGPLEMHCAPFHFVMLDDAPQWLDPAQSIDGAYHPAARDTMLVVPLRQDVQEEDIREAVDNLGLPSLVFLRHVRRLTFVDQNAAKNALVFALEPESKGEVAATVEIEHRGIRRDVLQVIQPRTSQNLTFQRYWTARAVPPGSERLNKATGELTPLGVCVCSDPSLGGALHDRIPLPIQMKGPLRLNAQFDPDGARSSILHTTWNKDRLADLGAFLGGIALDAFNRDTASGWLYVPLDAEDIQADKWIRDHYAEAAKEACHDRLVADLQLPTSGGRVPVSEIVYEDEPLDGLLTGADLEILAEGHSALLPGSYDSYGRWRDVLNDLGQSRALGVEDALEIFDHQDHIQDRPPFWFVKMAALAVDHGLWNEFAEKPALLLADGRIVACPERDEPRVLVRSSNPQSLAQRLGLSLPLHESYLDEAPEAKKVTAKLAATKILRESCDLPVDALRLLARADEPTDEPVRLEDIDLLALRDAWTHLPQEERREIGLKIGANIALRGISYRSGSRTPEKIWVRPLEAYLPAAIDRETDSFAKAAGKAPGLAWVDPAYAKLLKHERGRSEAGAQRFLAALGVAREPRLQIPENESLKWVRDPRPASAISGVDRPEAQLQAIRTGRYVDHLLDDRWSSDLEAVVEDIQAAPAKTKRKRALALLSVLSRGWDRHYAEHQLAKAAYGYNGYWEIQREVQATWLARLAASSWLPNGHGALRPPCELALPTDANRLTYGNDRGAYLAKIDSKNVRSDLLRALGVRLGPSGADLIASLQHLCDLDITATTEEQARTIYHLLAADLQSNTSELKAGRAMTPSRLRNAFRASPGRNGLLFTGGSWHSPETVLRGPPIFGDYRVFAPNVKELQPLWEALQIPKPTANDCVAVLRELARQPGLSPADQGVMLMTFRELASLIDEASPQLRAKLRHLPLWTGKEWSASRPMFVLDGEAIAGAELPGMQVWRPGYTSFSELQALFSDLHVIHLRLEDFTPCWISGAGIAEGDEHRQLFSRAVALLDEELARNDITLRQSLSCAWGELLRARLIIHPALEIAVQLEDQPEIRMPARAHMMREPLIFIVRSLEDAEASDAGGQAIASLFGGDRQKLAWAWSSVWRAARRGQKGTEIVLPSTKPEASGATSRLANLQAQTAARNKGSKKKARPSVRQQQAQQPVQVRQLRDISGVEPTQGKIVNPGASTNGVVFIKSRTKGQSGRKFEPLAGKSKGQEGEGSRKNPPTRSVLPPVSDREELAAEAVRRALRLDPEQIQDLRQRRGIGVDAIDELRQCYEIKMSSGVAFPTDVTLTASEVEAAQNDPDFFLAVVAGLEAGEEGCVKVRFIFDPLETLAAKIRGEVTLTGVDKAEALEYEFPADSPAPPES